MRMATPAECGMTAGQFADTLKKAGLKQVGVIKLYSCAAGGANLLSDLKQELATRDVLVGYVAGFKGNYSDARISWNVFGKKFNTNPFKFLGLPASSSGASMNLWRRASKDMVVVKGNVDVRFAGSRYDFAPRSTSTTTANAIESPEATIAATPQLA
jgi:hypothetical protein